MEYTTRPFTKEAIQIAYDELAKEIQYLRQTGSSHPEYLRTAQFPIEVQTELSSIKDEINMLHARFIGLI
ncbi:hypothetical protein WKW50_25135 [Ochrobactrum sp. GPK 3]|uniref:hypothetical protein n=1 Tax=Brucella sp. 22210 TaxID=3453892 RepID=UPI0031385FF8